jgi:hypothetical protein
MAAMGRIGRPTRPPVEGERIQIGVQVAPRVKKLLEAAAEQNNRSLSREAEFRLEQSFERDRLSRMETILSKVASALVPGFRKSEERHQRSIERLRDARRRVEEARRTAELSEAQRKAEREYAELKKKIEQRDEEKEFEREERAERGKRRGGSRRQQKSARDPS